jgi:xylulose-5-phosphate/fructose-6-phosphate phosphoketolase
VPSLGARHAALRQHMLDERLRCRAHTRCTGTDAPDVRDWHWRDESY